MHNDTIPDNHDGCGDTKKRTDKMEKTVKTDRQKKTEATKEEYRRVFDNYNLPGGDIYADCSDGVWIKRFWQNLNKFGWENWKRDN